MTQIWKQWPVWKLEFLPYSPSWASSLEETLARFKIHSPSHFEEIFMNWSSKCIYICIVRGCFLFWAFYFICYMRFLCFVDLPDIWLLRIVSWNYIGWCLTYGPIKIILTCNIDKQPFLGLFQSKKFTIGITETFIITTFYMWKRRRHVTRENQNLGTNSRYLYTRQVGRVWPTFYSPHFICTRIGERASAQFFHWRLNILPNCRWSISQAYANNYQSKPTSIQLPVIWSGTKLLKLPVRQYFYLTGPADWHISGWLNGGHICSPIRTKWGNFANDLP